MISEVDHGIEAQTYAQMFGDNVRDQFNATAFSDIETLDQRQGGRRWLNLAQQCFALGRNKLMWHNEN